MLTAFSTASSMKSHRVAGKASDREANNSEVERSAGKICGSERLVFARHEKGYTGDLVVVYKDRSWLSV
jgi:hypothetical protein